ncbi:MAG: hypothetical protein AB1726_11510 [Planctomycetota bacterium]
MSAVVAGVDEAGLGPLLGPLAIGYCALRLPHGGADPWQLLARSVAREPAKSERRIVVADSKRVFRRTPAGERRLELTALAFLALARGSGGPPAAARDVLFGALRPAADLLARHPWYEDLPPVPRAVAPGTLEIAVARLGRTLAEAGAAVLAAGVRLVPAGELNASWAATGNKADTVWERTLEVLRHLWDRYGEDGVEVCADLQGGRSHYGPLLARGFPAALVRRLREDRLLSSYELAERDEAARRGWLPRRMTVEFRAKGEEHSFAVALASCLAKYARETAMAGFNRYFLLRQPGLRPTAGYTTDGRRWLAEAAPALAAGGVAPDAIVRTR